MTIFADHVRAKRCRESAEAEALAKRFCSFVGLTDDSPRLIVTELPLPAAARSCESFYLMFKTWDVDMRIWAATDIQRIYRGWLTRRIWIKRVLLT
jgi:hypothetical protein